jgi:hypothetical protein
MILQGRVLDQYSVNAVSSVFRNHSARSFCLERAVLKVQVTIEQLSDFATGGWFLILFNARKMCSLGHFGICRDQDDRQIGKPLLDIVSHGFRVRAVAAPLV